MKSLNLSSAKHKERLTGERIALEAEIKKKSISLHFMLILILCTQITKDFITNMTFIKEDDLKSQFVFPFDTLTTFHF